MRYIEKSNEYIDRARKRSVEKKAEIKAQRAAKYLENLEANRAYRREWGKKRDMKALYQKHKARMDADPQFRAQTNLGARFRQLIKDKPQGGFQKIVGYSYDDLRRHLERQFDEHMTWDNYGSYWEVDHILPVTSFRLPDEANLCWALANLRPLHKTVNRQKSARRLYLI